MDRSRDVLTFPAVTYGWVAGLVAVPTALLVAAFGQGSGAFLGGCRWIGICLPPDRQVWALVNQPTLSFASKSQALGYWLGSLALPVLVAVTVVHILPRAHTLAAELCAVHTAWAAATIGAAWLPLLDPEDGHLVRMLKLRQLPAELVWTAPVVAAAAALIPAFRLLALARGSRPNTGRWLRVTVVTVHLIPPVAVWLAVVSLLRGEIAVTPALGMLLPVVVVVVAAWSRYPSPHVKPLLGLSAGSFVRAVVALVVIASVVWFAGRPLSADRHAGVLWATPTGLNNIRPWMAPSPLFTSHETAAAPAGNAVEPIDS